MSMKQMSMIFCGMAIQAFLVAGLQMLNVIVATPGQQALAGLLFLAIGAVTAVTEM